MCPTLLERLIILEEFKHILHQLLAHTSWRFGEPKGDLTGALGGYSYGNINLKIGESLFICIGGAGSDYNGNTGGLGGYNGGGNGGNGFTDIIAYGGCGGGGATHISVSNRGTLDNFCIK